MTRLSTHMALSPAHTSCECDCDCNMNVDVTNSQWNSHWVELCSTLLRISQRKRSCDVKFTSNLHRIHNCRKYQPGFSWESNKEHSGERQVLYTQVPPPGVRVIITVTSLKLGYKFKGMLKWCHFYCLLTPGVIDSKELLETVSKAIEG